MSDSEARASQHGGGRESVDSVVIDLNEASERLHCSYSTTLRLVKSGELRAFRIRDAWRTSTAACDEFIERGFAEQRVIIQSVEVGE